MTEPRDERDEGGEAPCFAPLLDEPDDTAGAGADDPPASAPA